ncbi:peptidylprolyl isomerase [Prevotella sp. 10(H)]|uniref:peptidylprolyl isomerase n=1 Tax=Prevotella sp. 10(H) TaxID=1158294 RepID=UPI0004A6AEF6|nr:peptidylprolyl isomerase [Prevotella sp. 10(H)]
MCNNKEKEPIVVLQTSYGNIKIKLYNETPVHRDNFIKLAEQGFYKDLAFHRVIKDFMIQGGDPKSRKTESEDDLLVVEEKKMGDTTTSEIKFPMYYNKRGALAAARWGDAENPTRASDASQFYIVTGELAFDEKLNELEKTRFERLKQRIYNKLQSDNKDSIKAYYKEGKREEITELRNKMLADAEKEAEARREEILYTEAQREFYKTRGGAPHLDNEYTVFGEVLEGMDVVDKIQNVKTNEKDKPIERILMNVVVLEK